MTCQGTKYTDPVVLYGSFTFQNEESDVWATWG